MKELIHVTKEGKKIPVSEMTNSHLKNTIHYIHRRIKKGVSVSVYDGYDSDDFWHGEYDLTDRQASHHLNLEGYLAEATRRGLRVY